jgi:hypothetical protein
LEGLRSIGARVPVIDEEDVASLQGADKPVGQASEDAAGRRRWLCSVGAQFRVPLGTRPGDLVVPMTAAAGEKCLVPVLELAK